MTGTSPDIAGLRLPAASLASLRRALIAEVGPDAAARALRRAGHAAGDAVFAAFQGSVNGHGEDALRGLDQTQYWHRLEEFLVAHGWGRLAHEAVHPGVGALDSPDWAEADPADGAARPSCFFTTGLLANLLGRSASEELGVLEVECRSRGDLRCRFVFGGAAALDPLYAGIATGRDVDASLADLA